MTQTMTHYERAAEVSDDLVAAHAAEESVASMARRYGLRREAVTAELANRGIGEPSAARDAVLNYVRSNPGLSIDDLALRLDLSKSSVSRYLRGAEEHKLVVSRKNAPVQQYTDEQMKQALKAAYRLLDDKTKGLSRKRYAELMAGKQNTPAAATFIRRWKTWSGACQAAGITASKARRENYLQEWSDDDIVDAVDEFVRSTGNTTYHAYAAWAKEHGRPSGPLLVQRLGGWAEARKLAITKRLAA